MMKCKGFGKDRNWQNVAVCSLLPFSGNTKSKIPPLSSIAMLFESRARILAPLFVAGPKRGGGLAFHPSIVVVAGDRRMCRYFLPQIAQHGVAGLIAGDTVGNTHTVRFVERARDAGQIRNTYRLDGRGGTTRYEPTDGMVIRRRSRMGCHDRYEHGRQARRCRKRASLMPSMLSTHFPPLSRHRCSRHGFRRRYFRQGQSAAAAFCCSSSLSLPAISGCAATSCRR